MDEFDKIYSLKNSEEKDEKIKDYYINNVNINDWLTNPYKNSIIVYKDRIEYKRNGKFHRINGPAIEYTVYNNQSSPNKFYYNGELIEEEEWNIKVLKINRRLKLKKIIESEDK